MVVLPLMLASGPANKETMTPSEGIAIYLALKKSLLTSAGGCYRSVANCLFSPRL